MEKLDLLEIAQDIAEFLGHTFIGTEHVLIAYYLAYNPDIAKVLIKRVKKRIGVGTPTKLDIIDDRTRAVTNIFKNSHNANEMILSIITNPYSNGALYLRR